MRACACTAISPRAARRSTAKSRRRWFAFTTQAPRSLYEARFVAGDVLVFGSESAGLPDDVLARFAPDARLRIPMRAGVRSLNLSNAVAVAVYEAWRQLGFVGGS
jgi:tRNA (cytidine/uridine-2'-O-)-methyltransferase